MKLTKNERMLLEVAQQLPEEIRQKVIFLGGTVVSLLLTDEAIVGEPRPTQDVDMIINASGRVEFSLFEKKLRNLGFNQVIEEGAPICRWRIGNNLVDIMPCDENILGFVNSWYKELANNYSEREIENTKFRIAKAPYFIATKVEAFLGRGENDFLLSHDLEDLITVIDGRPELIEEIKSSSKELQRYLKDIFSKWLKNPDFLDAIPGFLEMDSASQARYKIIVDRIKEIAKL